MGHLCDKNCPSQRLPQPKRLGEDVFTEREQAAQSASVADVAFTSGFDGEKLANEGNYGDCSVLSISSFPPGFLSNEELQTVSEGFRVNGNTSEKSGNSFPEPSTREMGNSYGFARNRSSLRSRRSTLQFIKPLTSQESCLMAQLYKEHAEMEEYMLSSLSLSFSPNARPLLVIDGRRVIGRARGNSFSSQIGTGENKQHKQTCSAENKAASGVPPLPNVGSLEISRMKVETEKWLGGKLNSSSKRVNGKQFHSLVGIISSFLANKREVDKLNVSLKQTENLVQDLQDELEMKDSLTVKELTTEDYESQETCCCSCNKRTPHSFSSEQNLDGSTKYDAKELPDQKVEEDSESMSKIEAELEVELERLELNMNSTTLEGRLSELVELDSDFIPSITRGELRPDMFGRQAGAQPYADRDGIGTSTPHFANHAVSSRELTLRLHEVIQSRLEERVKELETALENSQRKVQFMQSERKTFFRDFSDTELRSSSYQASPIAIEEPNAVDQPVVINLSGEALDAYNEARDEFGKMNESEEADLTGGKKNHQKVLPLFDRNAHRSQSGEVNRHQPDYTTIKGKASPALIPHRLQTSDEHISLGDVGFSEDDMDNGHDEMENLLIKQIVEKTRKGSSVIVHAEKALFLVDEKMDTE